MQPISKWITGVGALVVLLLTIDVVFLTRKNQQLEARLVELTVAPTLPPLAPGTMVRPFPVLTMDGSRQLIDVTEPGSTYLLYVFSTTCPHCLANLGRWKTIADSAAKGVYVVGVSIHDPKRTTEYVAERKVPFYSVCVADSIFESTYNIRAVPATILITSGGRVEGSWAGELSEDQKHVTSIAQTRHRSKEEPEPGIRHLVFVIAGGDGFIPLNFSPGYFPRINLTANRM